eukprot:9663018-Lingulodinium_polyedra.AAC.1
MEVARAVATGVAAHRLRTDASTRSWWGTRAPSRARLGPGRGRRPSTSTCARRIATPRTPL